MGIKVEFKQAEEGISELENTFEIIKSKKPKIKD